MRSTWTDSRLDDLAGKVDMGFARVDSELGEIRGEIGALNRTIIQVGGGLIGTVLVCAAGLIAAQL